jgi:hypothetical protein
MDMLLDGADLCSDRCVLAGKNLETESRSSRNAIATLISNNPEQLGHAIASLRRDNAKFG